MVHGTDAKLQIRTRLFCGEEIAMGPGKADLLEAIDTTGSISAAGRHLGMSYRRTWLLVDTMNRSWREPLVATALGGAKGGGARVTPFGREVLRLYRELIARLEGERKCEAASQLAGMLAEEPRPARE